MSTVLWLAVSLLLLLPAGANAGEPNKDSKHGNNLYFRDSSLESLAKQELATFPNTDAGESKNLERAFPDAPPQIPHTLEDMLPITLEENECLDCHDPENAIGKEDVPLPKSHFRHAVMGKGEKNDPMVSIVKGYEKGDEINGARYGCMMCHAIRSGNARVIGNSFERIAGDPTE
jgi:cytochrome c-type protein NapB